MNHEIQVIYENGGGSLFTYTSLVELHQAIDEFDDLWYSGKVKEFLVDGVIWSGHDGNIGDCNTCGRTYEISSQDGRCGNCGDCLGCCSHPGRELPPDGEVDE